MLCSNIFLCRTLFPQVLPSHRGVVGYALTAAVAVATPALAQDETYAGVTDSLGAAELVPAAASALPPILPGQEPGARERGAVAPTPPPADAAREWFGHSDWWTWSRGTGDWAGARSTMEDAGFTFNGSAITEWSRVFAGGLDNASAFRFLLDLNLTVELDKVVGLKGGKIFADFQNADTGVGALVHGGFQPYSNIAINGSITQLSQLWYEQWLFDDVLRVKVGKVDANTEFAYIPAAGGFINASAGFTPTIFALPTYPNPSTSINAFLYPTDEWYIGFGAYDGAATIDGVPTGSRGPATFLSDDLSDDWFLIAESGLTLGEAGFLRNLRISAGGWWLIGDVTTFDGDTDNGTGGAYALAQSRLWTPEGVDFANDDDTRGLWAFLQGGWSDPNVALAAQQYGGGVSLTGTFAGRDDDSTGVYCSYVVFGDDPTSGLGDQEVSLEVFYDIAITPFLHLKPDLQWFHDPSGDDSIDDSLVGTLRLTITF